MKKKKIIIGMVVFGGCLIAPPVFASTEGPVVVGNTDGTILFKENQTITEPRDPEHPADKLEGDQLTDILNNNQATNTKGPLSLNVIPLSFDFGESIVEMKEVTFFNQPETAERALHYLQVTDNRTKQSGWSVFAQRTEFSSGSDFLTGSKLAIPLGEARNSLNVDDNVVDNRFEGNAIDLYAGSDEDSKAQKIFAIPEAAQGESMVGKGVSTYEWNAREVALTVKEMTANVGNFTSTINWSIVSEVTESGEQGESGS